MFSSSINEYKRNQTNFLANHAGCTNKSKRIKDDKINQACPYLPIQNIWIIKNILSALSSGFRHQ